jgi:hypothetical protein
MRASRSVAVPKFEYALLEAQSAALEFKLRQLARQHGLAATIGPNTQIDLDAA